MDLALALGRRDGIVSPSMPSMIPGNLLGAVDRLGELDAGLMPRPVGKVLAAGQRPVDAGRD